MEAVSVNTYNAPPSPLHIHPTFFFPSRFLPASKSGIWGQTCWLWGLYAHKDVSLPPLCIILLLLNSAPLTPTFHQALSTSCDWGLFSVQPSDLHKKARSLYCTKKPVSSHTRKYKNRKKKKICATCGMSAFSFTLWSGLSDLLEDPSVVLRCFPAVMTTVSLLKAFNSQHISFLFLKLWTLINNSYSLSGEHYTPGTTVIQINTHNEHLGGQRKTVFSIHIVDKDGWNAGNYPEQNQAETLTACPSVVEEPRGSVDQISLPRADNSPSSKFNYLSLSPAPGPAGTSHATAIVAYWITSVHSRGKKK